MNLYQFSTTQTMNNKRIKNDKRDTFAIVHPGFHKGHFPLLIQPGEQLQCLRYFTKGIQINVTFQERLATKTLCRLGIQFLKCPNICLQHQY